MMAGNITEGLAYTDVASGHQPTEVHGLIATAQFALPDR